jgi:acyl-CoA thioesterase FadM
MLLLFRFLLVVFAGTLRSRVGPLDESRVRFTVLPNDCDLNIHLNAGRFVSFMDIAQMNLMVRMRVFFPLIRRGWRPIMGGCVVRYRHSIAPFERFEIRSRVLGWDTKWFYIEHLVERENRVCATGIMRVLIRHAKENVPAEDVIALTGMTLSSPPLPSFVEQWRDAEDAR